MQFKLPLYAKTGVGSLPGIEVSTAVSRILRHFPDLPWWPQFPALGPAAGMLWQDLPFLPRPLVAPAWEGQTGLRASELRDWLQGDLTGKHTPGDRAPGLLELQAAIGRSPAIRVPTGEEIHPDSSRNAVSGKPEARSAQRSKRSERTPAKSAPGELRVEESPRSCPGWVKGQMTGPLTLARCLKDANQQPLLERPDLHELLIERLLDAGTRQIRTLRSTGRSVLLFLDEPVIRSTPSLWAGLKRLICGLRAEGARIGLHCCAEPDWSELIELELDVLNLDVHRFPLTKAEDLRRVRGFLERGGRMAWGLVPAVEQPPPAAELLGLAGSSFGQLGATLLQDSLLTPCCGLAGLSEAGVLAVEERLHEVQPLLVEMIEGRP